MDIFVVFCCCSLVRFLFNLEQNFRRLTKKIEWKLNRERKRKLKMAHSPCFVRSFTWLWPWRYKNVTHVRFWFRCLSYTKFLSGLNFIYVYPWNELRLKCHWQFLNSHISWPEGVYMGEKNAWLALQINSLNIFDWLWLMTTIRKSHSNGKVGRISSLCTLGVSNCFHAHGMDKNWTTQQASQTRSTYWDNVIDLLCC